LKRTDKRRKKRNKQYVYFYLLIFLLLIISFLVGYKYYGNHEKDKKPDILETAAKVEAPKEENKPAAEITNKIEKVKADIILTSAGDCTIGTDSKFAFKNSLPDVFARNNNDYGYFFKNVAEVFKSDDITTANCETTFTDSEKKAEKEFTFKAPADYAKSFSVSGIEAVNVANNHIYDYLDKGYKDTLAALKAENVNYFGEGNKWTTEVKGVKIGYLGYRGFSYDNTYLKNLQNDIVNMKKQVQFLVINFHWGDEGTYAPNSTQKYLAHYAIDQGADLIVGHHPHVIQGLERYKGKIIAYSLGNFAFGGNLNPKDKDTFILQIKLGAEEGKLTSYAVKTIPCSISSVSSINNYSPVILSGSAKEAVFQRLNKMSINLGFTLKDEFHNI
jgi:poly-gamma-glutamate synthesis protein (capsule biosynthesis protein)